VSDENAVTGTKRKQRPRATTERSSAAVAVVATGKGDDVENLRRLSSHHMPYKRHRDKLILDLEGKENMCCCLC
jgi:hypothetical protein